MEQADLMVVVGIIAAFGIFALTLAFHSRGHNNHP